MVCYGGVYRAEMGCYVEIWLLIIGQGGKLGNDGWHRICYVEIWLLIIGQ
jgi:hypothetical protein